MSISLTPDVEAMIREKVDSGSYANASDAVRAGLQMLDERERLREFRQSLLDADAEIDHGEGMEWTPELKARLFEEGEEMVRRGIAPSIDVRP